jgi:hypothetical protein
VNSLIIDSVPNTNIFQLFRSEFVMEKTASEFFENSSRHSSQKSSRLHQLINVSRFDLCFVFSKDDVRILFNFLILRFYLPIIIQYLIKLKNTYVKLNICVSMWIFYLPWIFQLIRLIFLCLD